MLSESSFHEDSSLAKINQRGAGKMHRSLIRAYNIGLLTLLLAAVCLAQQPSVDRDKQREALQAEAAKERTAVGPWKQSATIESQHIEGFGSNDPKIPSRPGNRPIIGFLSDQRMILTDADHPIRVFDCATGKQLVSFGDKLPEYWNWRHWVSSSSGRLAMYVPHPTPQIWDTKTGELIATLPPFKSMRDNQEYQDNYPCAAFLPGDHALVTYRGDGDRGSGPDNLQIWDIDFQKKQVNLRRSVTVVRDARNMEMVGPYLLITGTYDQVLDATTFKSIYQQEPGTSERMLGLDPPRGDEPGRLLTLELARGGNWTSQQPHFRIVQLPEGKEIDRWKCPIEERGGNDHRYQASFALSPNRKIFAISQTGRVTFYDFKSGQKISTVQQADSRENCTMQFLNDNQVLLGKQMSQAPLSICEVSTGKELASIPEIDLYPVASPDGKYIAAKRIEVHVPTGKYVEVLKLPRPLVVIWRREEK
jgi:hypothetical protein